jgi:type I restriction enzyme S subunit
VRKTPTGWSTKKVDALFDVQLGKMLNEIAKAGDSQFPYLTNTNVQWARFRLDNLNKMHFSPREREKFSLRAGDLIVCEGGEVGRCAIWKEELTPCYFQKALHRLRPKNQNEVLPDYMLAYMRFVAGTKLLGDLTSQSSIAHLTRERFLELAVSLPPLPEQKKIADILGAWDEMLEKLDTLIAAKDRRKKALMQLLLSGKRGLRKGLGRWTKRPLGELVEPIVRTLKKPTTAFLAAGIRSHGRGVFLKPSFEPADIALDELFQIKKDDLIVNITFAWEGAVTIVPTEADGALVSHRFPTFRVRESEAALSFLRHYIRTQRFVFDCGLASPGGAGRNRVLSKSSFLEIELSVPSTAEQQEIGSVLDDADTELRLLHQQRTALDQQKRGLMQQLLTGQKRVTIN